LTNAAVIDRKNMLGVAKSIGRPMAIIMQAPKEQGEARTNDDSRQH